jgi:hypothetical protein
VNAETLQEIIVDVVVAYFDGWPKSKKDRAIAIAAIDVVVKSLWRNSVPELLGVTESLKPRKSAR